MTPASVGPNSRMLFMPAMFSETAFCNRAMPTSSAGIDCKAGNITPLVAPCATAATSRCS